MTGVQGMQGQAGGAIVTAPIRQTFFCIDGHTCGCPVRLVAGGGPQLAGATMSEKRQDFLAHMTGSGPR